MDKEPKLIKSKKQILKPGIYYYCSCKDKEEPICDKNHTDCVPFEFEVTEEILRGYCTCKFTKTPPYCDSYHKLINFENGFPPPVPKS